VLTGVPLGECTQRWSDEYLGSAAGDLKVSVHVSDVPGLDFTAKNFRYEMMALDDMLARARGVGGDRRYYYYRSLHSKRNRPASLECVGALAGDFALPLALLHGAEVHSTVLRVASVGLRMWLHYDVCDNFLCCVRGRKRVVLLHPREVGGLYVNGSSSLLGSRALDPDADRLEELWREFPLARAAWSRRLEVELEAGDVLYIPALWPHCTEALPARTPQGALRGASCAREIALSTNVFVVRPELAALHDPKDVWANRELLPAQEALRALEERVVAKLQGVPGLHRAFYCRKAASALLALADAADRAAAQPDRTA